MSFTSKIICAAFASFTLVCSSITGEQPLSPNNYDGYRTSDDKEIKGKGKYDKGGFNLSWEIAYDGSNVSTPWHYIYTIGGNDKDGSLKKDLGDFLLETNEKAIRTDFQFVQGGTLQGPAYFDKSVYKHLPSKSWFGLLFENIDSDWPTLEFYSAWSPMWGDFFAESDESNKTYAYNDEFGNEPGPRDAPFHKWIAAPGYQRVITPAPEPQIFFIMASFLLFAFFVKRVKTPWLQIQK